MKKLFQRKIEKSYLMGIGLLSIFLVVGYFSYAYFTLQTEEKNKISIITGTLQATLTSKEEGFKNHQITVEANEEKEFVITLENKNERDAKFNFYYLEESKDVEIGYKSGTHIPPGIEGRNIKQGEKEEYTICIRNESTSPVTITIQSDAGLADKDLTFKEEGHIFEEFREENAPKLGEGMIPVVYNEGTHKWEKIKEEDRRWYDYKKKEWANAVILVDNPSKEKGYEVGEAIEERDIESYFVWIPRYKYRIFDEGNYEGATTVESAPTVSIAKEIEIKFQEEDEAKEEGSTKGTWLTHPAFTLGGKELSGIWVGKFETGYNQSGDGTSPIYVTSEWTQVGAQVDDIDPDKIIVKPNVYSWKKVNVHNIFMNAYQYKRELDSHMMKNIEWGAMAYLSHSKYGILKEVNINNNSAYLTGYSATSNTNQNRFPGEYGTEPSVTQPYNTETGYLASTTGNITGIYDVSGGGWEYMAAYMDGYGVKASDGVSSGFSEAELEQYKDYLDKYPQGNATSYKNRILGDATGEMGPFYLYQDGDGVLRYHNAWYAECSYFVETYVPWFGRGGGDTSSGVFAGQFYFGRNPGRANGNYGFRLVLTTG